MNSLLNTYCTFFVLFFSVCAYSRTSTYEKDANEIREYLISPGKTPRPDLLKKIKDYKTYYASKQSTDTLLQVLSFEIRHSLYYDLYEPTYELCKTYFTYDSTFNNPYNSWTVKDYIGVLELLYKKKELLQFIKHAYSTYDKNNTPTELLSVFANAYYELNEYRLAIETYTLIYNLSETDQNFVKAGMQNNIGLCYDLLGDKINALKHYQLAKNQWLKIEELKQEEVHPDYFEYMLGVINTNILKAETAEKHNDCELLTVYQDLVKSKHIQKSIDTYFPYNLYVNLIKYSFICGERQLTETYLQELSESNTLNLLSDKQRASYHIINTLMFIHNTDDKTLINRKQKYDALLTLYHVNTSVNSNDIRSENLLSKNLSLTNQILESKNNIVLKEQRQNRLEKIIFGLSFIIISILIYFLYRIYSNSKLINHQKQELNKALDEREVLIKEIHHRVKNNLQMISGFAVIEQSRNTDKFDTQSFSNQIKSVATVYNILSDTDTLTDVDFNAYVIKLGDGILKTFYIEHIRIYTQIHTISFSLDYTIYLGLILNELITNTIKHSKLKENGEIHIGLQCLGSSTFKLVYRDNGIGISHKTNSKHIGTRLIESLSKKVHATSKSYNNNGFVFELTFNQIDNE